MRGQRTMYIGDMFCYGQSTDSVGVNGIVGCMGVFVASGQTLYAIHMPDSINYNTPGRNAFVQFVGGAIGNGNAATVIGVLNNDNRPSAAAELREIARGLGASSYRMVRLRKHIDIRPSGEPEAAAVLCMYTPNGYVQGTGMTFSSNVELRYQMDKRVRWVDGQGEARSGQYRAMRGDSRLWTNAAWGAGWNAVDSTNCDLTMGRV